MLCVKSEENAAATRPVIRSDQVLDWASLRFSTCWQSPRPRELQRPSTPQMPSRTMISCPGRTRRVIQAASSVTAATGLAPSRRGQLWPTQRRRKLWTATVVAIENDTGAAMDVAEEQVVRVKLTPRYCGAAHRCREPRSSSHARA
jgi:hypothetical protein